MPCADSAPTSKPGRSQEILSLGQIQPVQEGPGRGQDGIRPPGLDGLAPAQVAPGGRQAGHAGGAAGQHVAMVVADVDAVGGRQAEAPGLELEAAGQPVLVIWGREDRIIPARHAANAPAGASVEVLDGAGHMAMMEKAGDVNGLVKRHIARA